MYRYGYALWSGVSCAHKAAWINAIPGMMYASLMTSGEINSQMQMTRANNSSSQRTESIMVDKEVVV
jgi:hypothetical protein